MSEFTIAENRSNRHLVSFLYIYDYSTVLARTLCVPMYVPMYPDDGLSTNYNERRPMQFQEFGDSTQQGSSERCNIIF